ncbi:hypothetical protein Prubr_54320 [Polymorphospora rubra]|uniref:Uncharacterized protein n=1 Tax=Polymorphospora rubra TaxID=338584 RepID=A0A810N3X3_9ACTN|nr:hypothetical protein Prubr_54320 [Polymorphospora rubra]
MVEGVQQARGDGRIRAQQLAHSAHAPLAGFGVAFLFVGGEVVEREVFVVAVQSVFVDGPHVVPEPDVTGPVGEQFGEQGRRAGDRQVVLGGQVREVGPVGGEYALEPVQPEIRGTRAAAGVVLEEPDQLAVLVPQMPASAASYGASERYSLTAADDGVYR